MTNNVSAVVKALLDLGIIFIPSNGNGPGVRLAKPEPEGH